MRQLDVALAVVLVLALLGALWFLLGRSDRTSTNRAEQSAPWRAHDVSRDGVTHVVVRRTVVGPEGETVELESREVAAVPDADPDYDELLAEAMGRARARAEVLDRERRTSA
ncbi:hypothetical protein [Angustibacter aerolatus]